MVVLPPEGETAGFMKSVEIFNVGGGQKLPSVHTRVVLANRRQLFTLERWFYVSAGM